MTFIEKYYGIENTKQLNVKRPKTRSNRYLARLEQNNLLKHVNMLFVSGNSDQCYGLLKKAVSLAPNDFRPYYLLGLIHEDNGNIEKSQLSYMSAAILKNNDTSLWKKALSMSFMTNDKKNQILGLERIYKKEPSEANLLQKLSILKELKRKSSIIACQIQLFDYQGVDQKIFEKFKNTSHLNSLKKIGASLYSCIKNNKDARNEIFLRKSIYTLYKTQNWRKILNILDSYYFKDNEIIHPDIRFVYLIAVTNLKECRYDNLLDLDNLLNDENIWNELENINYVYYLVESYRNQKEYKKAIELLEKLIKIAPSTKPFHVLGDIYYELGNLEAAIYNYNQILTIDSVNIIAKTKLYDIYDKLGYNNLAKGLETPCRVTEYIKEVENKKKHEFRYSTKKCKETRELYEKIFCSGEIDRKTIVEMVKPLIDDFLNNPFAVIKDKNFRAFSSKNEKKDFIDPEALVLYHENSSKKELSDFLIRISSLHGLDVDEWFIVVKETIISLIMLEKYEEAIDIVKKCFDVYIFRENDLLIQILFLGLRLYLMCDDYDGIIDVFREIYVSLGYNSIYFLYSLSYFFPDFCFNKNFGNIQKNIQRVTRRDLLNPRSAQISELLSIISFTPRFLQTETVDFINSNIESNRKEVNIIKGVISIIHTKSRTLADKRKYAIQGIKYLKSIENDVYSVYNLAKAYHFFGYYSHAENFYLKVVDSENEELRNMAIFNLSLIFKGNKSRKVIEHLISKHRI